MKNQLRNNYSLLFQEYYNEVAHPTCSNLGMGSRILLEEWLTSTRMPGAVICEVGAGRSALIEALHAKISESKFIVTDSSEAMLSHSKHSSKGQFNLVVCDADNLPFRNKSIDYIVSLLGDPYNTDSFWKEVSRTLTDRGAGIFTTPSWHWASAFRDKSANENRKEAMFITNLGETIYVPSHVYPEIEQEKIMHKHGLKVDKIRYYTKNQLKSDSPNISSKIDDYVMECDPIVTSYHFSRI